MIYEVIRNRKNMHNRRRILMFLDGSRGTI